MPINKLVDYYSYDPISTQYESTSDPANITKFGVKDAKSVAGRTVNALLSEGSWLHLVNDLSTTNLDSAFNTAAIRLHNALLVFLETADIKESLLSFDFNSAVLSNSLRRSSFSLVGYETGWSIKTKNEDVFVELATHLEEVMWPLTTAEQVRIRMMSGGRVKLDSMPKLRWCIYVKIFNSPASCYAIRIHEMNIVVPFSDEWLERSNLDFYVPKPNLYGPSPKPPTQQAKERYEQRFPYFRKRK